MRCLLATAAMLVAAALSMAAQNDLVARPQGLVTRPGDPPPRSQDQGQRQMGQFCSSQDAACRSRLGLDNAVFYPYAVYWPISGVTPIIDFNSTESSREEAAKADLQAELNRQQRKNQELQQQLREERSRRDAEDPAPPAKKPATNSAAPPSAPAPPPPDVPDGPTTILVYRDGTRVEVQNYAIMGDALFQLDAQHAKKRPLTDLDMPATIKVNDDRGVAFLAPKIS